MSSLAETILNNWKTDHLGQAQIIDSLKACNYPAWTISIDEGYGVAVPCAPDTTINEFFSGARIYSSRSAVIENGHPINVLVLLAQDRTIAIPFSALCAALVNPGSSGEIREAIQADPLSWWKEWKELLGNKNIDARIYDVLGELCVLYKTIQLGEGAHWNGPHSSSYDIETDIRFIEVKSTVSRSKREVTISSQFQLYPGKKPLYLVLCVFEHTINSGLSINMMIDKFRAIGYNVDAINHELAKKGLEIGTSARDCHFLLHEMLSYEVNDEFPHITPASVIGGVQPTGITDITYTVDLNGLEAEAMVQGADHDL